MNPTDYFDNLVEEHDISSEYFKSNYTGNEVEAAIKTAIELPKYIQTHVQPPVVLFTGDYLEVELTTITTSTWLHGIVMTVKSAFSKSTPKYEYGIVATTGEGEYTLTEKLLSLEPEHMMTQDMVCFYPIDKLLSAGTTVSIVENSINAYGEIEFKLIFS